MTEYPMDIEFALAVDDCANGDATKLVQLLGSRAKFVDHARDALAKLIQDDIRVRRRSAGTVEVDPIVSVHSGDNVFRLAVHDCERGRCEPLADLLQSGAEIGLTERDLLKNLVRFLAAIAAGRVSRGRPVGRTIYKAEKELQMGAEYRLAIETGIPEKTARHRVAKKWNVSEGKVREVGGIVAKVLDGFRSKSLLRDEFEKRIETCTWYTKAEDVGAPDYLS